MRNALTFIELMTCISIVAIVCAAIPNIMGKRNVTPPPNPTVDVPIGSSTYKAQKFELEGHSYFLINHPEWHGFTAVHNPDCPKCKPAPVKELKVEVENQ